MKEEEHQQVCRWLGAFIPPIEIPKLIQDTFGKHVDKSFAHQFLHRKKWQVLIDRYRQQWLVKEVEIPLAHRKVRLEKIQRMVQWLESHQASVQPERFERRMLHLLEAARLEMEDKKDGSTNYFFQQNISGANVDELLREREALVKRIQAFHWPNTRRITHAVGNGREIVTEAGDSSTESRGGDEQVGDA